MSERLDSIRARLLADLTGRERYGLFASEVARVFELPLERASEALRSIREAPRWQPGPFPGARVFTTPALAARGVVIASLPAGLHIPVHPHHSRELTFVLDGQLSDRPGRTLGPGDVLDMPAGSEHAIRVVGEDACLALFCASAL